MLNGKNYNSYVVHFCLSKKMWQMGIDVMPEYKGHGIGATMVALLKNKIMDTGILPYYGTAASHIKSQMTAVRAGFTPGWLELCTMSVDRASVSII